MLPRERILRAFKDELAAIVPLIVPCKVRHHRHRPSAVEEWPCVAVRYVSDDASGVTQASDAVPSLGEEIMELGIELVIDAEIPPEVDLVTAGDIEDDDDPTGFAPAAAIVEACLGVLFREGEEVNTLGGLIWDARYDGSGEPDDNVTTDNVRLSERLTLVYRVRAEAPHVLLTGE